MIRFLSAAWFAAGLLPSLAAELELKAAAKLPDWAAGWRVTGVIRQGSRTEASVEHRIGWKRFVREGNEWSPGVLVDRIDFRQLTVTLRHDEQTVLLRSGSAPAVAKPPAASGHPSATNATELAAKLVLPHIELHELGLYEAIEFLQAQSRELDPDKKGVSILFNAPRDAKPPKITINLRNIPLLDAAKLVAQVSDLELVADERALRLEPKTAK